jgi:hypothetical protein
MILFYLIWFYIGFKQALYIRKVLHPHIKFVVMDSVIILITGTIFRSDFKRLFVTLKTELSSDNALIATLSVIDPPGSGNFLSTRFHVLQLHDT